MTTYAQLRRDSSRVGALRELREGPGAWLAIPRLTGSAQMAAADLALDLADLLTNAVPFPCSTDTPANREAAAAFARWSESWIVPDVEALAALGGITINWLPSYARRFAQTGSVHAIGGS